jgi:three-Cys-motif partner protein
MAKKPKDDTVGPWAKEKLGALGEYLGYYSKVLKNRGEGKLVWCKGIVYIDAFAGLGRTEVRSKGVALDAMSMFDELVRESQPEVREVIDGSPRVALSTPDKFDRYVFIERDPKRMAQLEGLEEEFKATHKIALRKGDCNAELQQIVVESGIDWKSHRAVCFLDPFGMHVPWKTIEMLGRTKAIEVLINFPLDMAIQRVLTRTGALQPGWREALDEFFGSGDWWGKVYAEKDNLFGSATEKLPNAGDNLLQWYCERLKAEFGNVAHPRLVKNTRGNGLYYLIWAGPHKKGLEGADYILKHYDKIEQRKRVGKGKKGK